MLLHNEHRTFPRIFDATLRIQGRRNSRGITYRDSLPLRRLTSPSHSVFDSLTRHCSRLGFWKLSDPHRRHRIPQERLQGRPTSLRAELPVIMTNGNLGGSPWFGLRGMMNMGPILSFEVEAAFRIPPGFGCSLPKYPQSRRCAEMLMSTPFLCILRTAGIPLAALPRQGVSRVPRSDHIVSPQLRTVADVGIVF